MKIAFVTAESLPFVKTGGLGDVSYSLTQGLAKQGHEVILFMPMYTKVKVDAKTKHEFNFSVGHDYVGINTCMVNGVKYVFIDNEYYFHRTSHSSYYYGHGDDAERFIMFSRAVLDYFGYVDWFPDLIHANDWHTAMIPYILNSEHRNNPKYLNIRTYLTIHNIEFQGWFPKERCHVQDDGSIMKNDSVNFLKAGILNATKINTVSPTYRDATLTSAASYGLDPELNSRSVDYVGILNGIDYKYFTPTRDKVIYKSICKASYMEDKEINKKAFKEEVGFTELTRPLYCMITRLTHQKGIDLIITGLKEMLEENLDVYILGSGDYAYEQAIENLSHEYDNLKFFIGYNEDLAHKLYAASDFILMPSRFEPCGLSQMIAMRYGCVPIVHDVDGLHDSVISYNEFDKTGNGLKFNHFSSDVIVSMVKYTQFLYYNYDHLKVLRQNCMTSDFSTDNMVEKYLDMYL